MLAVVEAPDADFPGVESQEQPAGQLQSPQPAEEPQVLSEVLTATANAIRNHVAMSPFAADAAALWVAHAWLFDCFEITPRLHIRSPAPRCGKTTLLELLAELVPAPLRTENATSAVIVRAIAAHRPTMLLDEVDTFLHGKNELRGVLNAGHRRGGKVLRCGGGGAVMALDVFCPLVLAGIGSIPTTLADRSITIVLARRAANQLVTSLRSGRVVLKGLGRRLARVARDSRETFLACAEPAMPNGLGDRAMDNWRGLVAIADVAGSEWPQRARDAASALARQAAGDSVEPRLRLLHDVRSVFDAAGGDRLTLQQIVSALLEDELLGWKEALGHRPLTTAKLANILRDFEVNIRRWREHGKLAPRGYFRSDLEPVWNAYDEQQGGTAERERSTGV